MSYPYIMTDTSVTVIIDLKPSTILPEENGYTEIRNAIIGQDWDTVAKLVDKEKLISNFSIGNIEVKDGCVYFHGEEMHGYVVNKILQFIREGIDAEPLINFLNKIMNNPSKHCIDQLFSFLEHKNMPIDPDGDFYAYKAIKNDWRDKHTGTIDNSIGTVVKVTRNTVDDNHDVGCSKGLHAGSMSYVTSFRSPGDRIVIVKINPGDVVTVPREDMSKLRCCRYEVVAEFESLLPDTTYDYDEDEEDDNDYWDEEGDDNIFSVTV